MPQTLGFPSEWNENIKTPNVTLSAATTAYMGRLAEYTAEMPNNQDAKLTGIINISPLVLTL